MEKDKTGPQVKALNWGKANIDTLVRNLQRFIARGS